jgi:adenine deaminase
VILGLAFVGRHASHRGGSEETIRPALERVVGTGAQARPIGITHVTVIDVENNRRLRDQTIVIEGKRIATVGPSDQVRVPDGYGVVDGRGKFVIPGFVDVRLFATDSSAAPPPDVSRGRLERDVLLGVTTIVLRAGDTLATPGAGDVLVPRAYVARETARDAVALPAASEPARNLGMHDYLRRLVQLGLTPATALRSATFDAARFGGLSSRVGSIAPSKMADLLILSANPLDEVGNVALIDAIVVDGRFVDGAERNARLARLPSR